MTKKLFLLGTMLLMTIMAQAQALKVSPKMKKGETKTYAITTKTNAVGKEVTMTYDALYTVTDATGDGYVVNYKLANVSTSSDTDDLMGRLLNAATELMASASIDINTDKDGQPQTIKDFDQVKAQMGRAADKLIDEMVKAQPDIENAMPRETLKQQIMAGISEDLILKSIQNNGVMALNGKTVMTGAQDEYVSDQGMKMKRMYFAGGANKITTTSTTNMSKEELKQLIIDKVTEMAPDQAETVKQNIDMVLASGMIKMDTTEKANYELGADGWMQHISAENRTEAMGQVIETTTTITLK